MVTKISFSEAQKYTILGGKVKFLFFFFYTRKLLFGSVLIIRELIHNLKLIKYYILYDLCKNKNFMFKLLSKFLRKTEVMKWEIPFQEDTYI